LFLILKSYSQGKIFPRAIFSTCYYHLVVVGWKTHVFLPNKKKDLQAAEPLFNTIKHWIHSWFFEVETELEYLYSRDALDKWLGLQRESGTLPHPTIDSVRAWLHSSIFVQDQYWRNYDRLFVGGMECRTTSIVESMHSSLKASFDKVHQHNSPETTAQTCVNKGKRKADEISRSNARQVARKPTWTNSNTYLHLTARAEDDANQQGEAADQLVVVQRTERLYHVFKPDNPDSIATERRSVCCTNTSQNPIPTFYRLRTVEISVCRNYAWCSCGFGDRYKAPCRHIIKVFGDRYPQMYSVRWFIHYQYFFERESHDNLTDYFRKRESEEWQRNAKQKEQIYVKGLKIPAVVQSDDDVEIADRLIFWNEEQRLPRLRGQPLPCRSEVYDNVESCFPFDDHEMDDGIFHTLSQHSEATIGMFERDRMQAAQRDLQQSLAQTSEYAVTEVNQLVREQLNLARGDRDAMNFLIHSQKDAVSKLRQWLVEQQQEKSGGVLQELSFSQSARNKPKRKIEKRKPNTDGGVSYGSLCKK
jgi:hypothetical protein